MANYQNGAQYLRWKAQKKALRERVAKLRADRDAKGLCRRCGKPAVVSKRTKKLTRSCQQHLNADQERKGQER